MRKLLIADTVASFNDSLSSLAGSEFEVRVCTDGQQALSLLRSFQPDALVIDLRLPGIDGFVDFDTYNGSYYDLKKLTIK